MEDQKKGKVQLPDGRVFNFEDHNLYSGDDTILKANLQGYEYDVFYCLADHYPTPQSVDQLIALIWEKKNPPITPDPSRVRQVIGDLRAFLGDKKPFKLIIWVNKSIYSDGGYKCCSQLIVSNVDSGEPSDRKPKKSHADSFCMDGYSQDESNSRSGNVEKITNSRQGCMGGTQNPHEDNTNIINLAALVIHKNSEDRPPIDDDLRYEISEIIKLLEQGLSEDFEEICEQAWAELSLMQKAMKIFKAYENLTDRSPTLSPTDTNTRL